MPSTSHLLGFPSLFVDYVFLQVLSDCRRTMIKKMVKPEEVCFAMESSMGSTGIGQPTESEAATEPHGHPVPT